MPAEEDAPVELELEDEPVDAEVWGAEPGLAVGIPALGLLELELPEPLEEDEEEEEDEDDEGEPEEPPLGEEGIPEELPPEDVVQPASTNRLPAAIRTAARCKGATTSLAVRFMVLAPSGRPLPGQQPAVERHPPGCRASVGFSS